MLDRRKAGFEECPLMVGHLSSRCDSVCLKPWGMRYAHFMAIKEEGTWGIEPPDLATWLFSHLYRRTCNAGASRQITPGYVFSFFLLGDCASRISWDFFHAAGARDLNRQWRCSSFVEETSPGNLPGINKSSTKRHHTISCSWLRSGPILPQMMFPGFPFPTPWWLMGYILGGILGYFFGG